MHRLTEQYCSVRYKEAIFGLQQQIGLPVKLIAVLFKDEKTEDGNVLIWLL